MRLPKFLRNWLRTRARRKLRYCAASGARVAHLPAFLDRAPRHDLHRALRHAFMRGFVWEQREMDKFAA